MLQALVRDLLLKIGREHRVAGLLQTARHRGSFRGKRDHLDSEALESHLRRMELTLGIRQLLLERSRELDEVASFQIGGRSDESADDRVQRERGALRVLTGER